MKFFGASLDALDTAESVAVKLSWLDTEQQGEGVHGKQPHDPYDLFRKMTGDLVEDSGHKNLGRFSVESWLSPRPRSEDRPLINQASYYQFFEHNGFFAFSKMLKDFVHANIFPDFPGMIGVDHSLTGGVLMALSERFGPEDISVLVFDTHTDAIPLPIRYGLRDYTAQNRLSDKSMQPITMAALDDRYSSGNFLLHLMDQGVILPQNLIIIGPADGPEPFRGLDDPRIASYVRHYDALVERGVTPISQADLKTGGPELLKKALAALPCQNMYLSLDVDISALRGILAARFFDQAGCDMDIVLQTIALISDQVHSGRFRLVGLDIMEMDVHKIGARLKSGDEDGTSNFLREYMSLFLQSCPVSQRPPLKGVA